ncbi:MAG: DUF3857 domain-containing protein [Phycisphaerales bacterium]|nr:DUF3857 domain-containing protein [Phycisphaerales bacterium]
MKTKNMIVRTQYALLCLGLGGVASAAWGFGDPTPDALIERWEQTWALGADGSQVYRELRHVRLNHERGYGEFVDPRITFDAGSDTVNVLVARTRLPDGRTLDVPDYSRNEVSPGGPAGWPAYAGIRQIVLTYSGIEPGCTVELEYEITSKPGARPHPEFNLQLDQRYPIKRRQVRVELAAELEGAALLARAPQQTRVTGVGEAGTFKGQASWNFSDVPAAVEEPYAAPWAETRPRLMFCLAAPVEAWLARNTRTIEAAADSSELITRLAREWTQNASTPGEKLRAIQEKLAATFNFVDFGSAPQPAGMRLASQALSANYGHGAAAAAVFAALAKGAGVAARVGVVVSDAEWSASVPLDAAIAGHVLVLDAGTSPEFWSARSGRIERSASWDGHTVLVVADSKVQAFNLRPWTDAAESRCEVAGKLTLSDDSRYAGKVNISLTGLFISPASLVNRDQQRERLTRVVTRLVDKATVADFTVTSLSADGFSATVDVKSSDMVDKLDGGCRVMLAADAPWMADVAMPLTSAARTQPVRIEGAFEDRVDLSVEWPSAWKLDVRPIEVAAVQGEWGGVEQRIRAEANTLNVSRRTRVARRDLSAEDFSAARKVINALRADGARMILLKP